MKIAQIISTYPPYRGGMGAVAASYTEELRGLGHEVDVFTPQYGKERPQDDPHIHFLKPPISYGNAAFIPDIYKQLDGYDVIHLHYPFFGGAEVAAGYKKRHPKTPLIVSYHMDVVGQGLLRAFFFVHRKLILPFIVDAADKIIVSSKDYADHSFLAGMKQAKGKIVEIPFGIARDFSPSEDRYEDPRKTILFVGGLDKAHYFKGISVLLQSVKQLAERDEIPPFQLNIVGKGDQRETYEQQARELGISDSVRFAGGLSDKQLVKAYQQARVTVLPSLDRSEAFGLVLAESMACGTPVVASDLPGVRSLIKKGETGFMAAPGDSTELADAIGRMLSMPDEQYQSMRVSSVRRVEQNYRWPELIRKVEQVYQSVL